MYLRVKVLDSVSHATKRKVVVGGYFSKWDIQTANKHSERCLTSLLLRKCANHKYVERQLHTHQDSRMATLLKWRISSKCWEGCGGTGTLKHCWQASKMVQHHGNQYGGSQNGNVELPDDLVVPLLDISVLPTKNWKQGCKQIFAHNVGSSITYHSYSATFLSLRHNTPNPQFRRG